MLKKLNQIRVPSLSGIAMAIALAGSLHFMALAAMAQPAQLNKVEIKPTTVEGGQPIEVVIRLTKKGNMWVKLNSSNTNIIPVKPNMSVHLNNVSSKSVFLNTNVISGSSQFVTISVTAGSVTRNASLSVTPPGALGGGGAYSIYKIKNSELAVLYKLAKSKGWTFQPSTEFGGPISMCTINEDAKGIKIVAANPEACFFDFFGGSRRLAAGWTLNKLVWSRLPGIRRFKYIEKPDFGTDNLHFKVHFIPKTGSAVFSSKDSEHLFEIWLKGPQGGKWQDAF